MVYLNSDLLLGLFLWYTTGRYVLIKASKHIQPEHVAFQTS